MARELSKSGRTTLNWLANMIRDGFVGEIVVKCTRDGGVRGARRSQDLEPSDMEREMVRRRMLDDPGEKES